jgi:hypothetical protein
VFRFLGEMFALFPIDMHYVRTQPAGALARQLGFFFAEMAHRDALQVLQQSSRWTLPESLR